MSASSLTGLAWILIANSCFSWAGELKLPSSALERDAVVSARYRLTGAVTGKGSLHIHWTDALGRVVEDRSTPFELIDESEIQFPLDLRRAVAMKNDLEVHVSIQGKNQKGDADNRDETARISFVAMPPD